MNKSLLTENNKIRNILLVVLGIVIIMAVVLGVVLFNGRDTNISEEDMQQGEDLAASLSPEETDHREVLQVSDEPAEPVDEKPEIASVPEGNFQVTMTTEWNYPDINTPAEDSYVENAKKAGLQIHACYMVGNNGETKETMKETLRLALELDTDTAQFYPLLPFPGTEAYFWAKENGYLRGSYTDYVKEDGTINCLLELSGISGEDLVRFCDEARKKYYMRPKYIIHRIVMGIKDPSDMKRSIKAFLNIRKYLFK